MRNLHAQPAHAAAVSPPAFLFLQGPHGFFFPRLGAALRARGARVLRINFNGGDQATWPEGRDYRGPPSRFGRFVAAFMRREAISDLVLYGDCRDLHRTAAAEARAAGIRVHVFEEGYLRPDWITLERDGVNGYSRLPSDPAWYRAHAAGLPAIDEVAPLPGHAAQRRWAAFYYYAQVVLKRWRFPLGPTHRARNPVWEGITYLWRFRRAAQDAKKSRATLGRLRGRPAFLFPLQLDSDYQIRIHSPFDGMHAAVREVVESFARNAPADRVLLVKEHPLESGLIRWRPIFDALTVEFKLGDRLLFVEQGDLTALTDAAAGVITVNSTSGTLALAAGKPVKVLGDAVYNMPGLTDQRPLAAFWTDPQPPDAGLFDAFCRVLADRILIRGAFLSDAPDATIAAAAARLIAGGGGWD